MPHPDFEGTLGKRGLMANGWSQSPPTPTHTHIHTLIGYYLTSLIPPIPLQVTRMVGEIPSQSLPRLRVGLPQDLAFDFMSLASVSFLFPLPPSPAPPQPYTPFNRHPLLLPSSFLSPLPGVRGSSFPTMDLLTCLTLLK